MVDPAEEGDFQLGRGSIWLLRLGSAGFLLVLGWFLVDAIIG